MYEDRIYAHEVDKGFGSKTGMGFWTWMNGQARTGKKGKADGRQRTLKYEIYAEAWKWSSSVHYHSASLTDAFPLLEIVIHATRAVPHGNFPKLIKIADTRRCDKNWGKKGRANEKKERTLLTNISPATRAMNRDRTMRIFFRDFHTRAWSRSTLSSIVRESKR